MKKIGIVTLHGYWNYGNRLQNYALKKVLENLGYEVDTTVISKNNKSSNFEIIKKKLSLRKILVTIRNLFIPSIGRRIRENLNSHSLRVNAFKTFSDMNLSENFLTLSNKKDIQILKEYDYFVAGSDQIWNPLEIDKMSVYFLDFAHPKKRISYAASFGRTDIPENLIEKYKYWLNGMKTYSVREKAGADIVWNLVQQRASVHLDPTMLLSKKEWLEISNKAHNRPEESYILTYFLGGPSIETREKIQKIALEKNMTVINLGDITEKDSYETGPAEFIDYINNASLFYTDSFHGVAFSILLETPFIVFKRLKSGPSMYSRIETLLEKFAFMERQDFTFSGDAFEMDFSNSHRILEQEKEKSINYLKESLQDKERK